MTAQDPTAPHAPVPVADATKPVAYAPVRRAWAFDARKSLDLPFHGLVSHFGLDIVLDLDEIVLDTPINAAIRATHIYQDYSARLGLEAQTRDVMQHLAQAIKPELAHADTQPLVPPSAIYHGRPKG